MAEQMKNPLEILHHSPEELFSRGKEYLDNFRYSDAELVFGELYRNHREFNRASGLYSSLASALYNSESLDIDDRLYKSELITDKVVRCIMELATRHSERTLSTDDLFAMELLIDRIPFEEIIIQNREEFEIVYCKFKEYCIQVFLKENKK